MAGLRRGDSLEGRPVARDTMGNARTGAALGAAIFVVAMQVPAVVVATQLPRDVARQAFLAFWGGALVQYTLVGALSGFGIAVVLGRIVGHDAMDRRWVRFLFPHLLLVPLVCFSAALGDRDWIHWLLVGGVATGLSPLLLLRLRVAMPAVWILGLVLSAVPWLVLQRSTPVERPPILEPPAGSPPDLALVVLDTVRRDRLALYGDLEGGSLDTPALQALAADGVRFDAAYAASPWSAPSHATLFTGKVPTRHGTTSDTLHLEADQLTLAEHLRRHGYLTAGFSGNPWVSDATGLTRGFTRWVERGGEAGIASHFLLARILDASSLVGSRDKGGRAIVEALDAFLQGSEDAHPRFVFVNLSEPHAPYWRVPSRARRAHGANSLLVQRASLRTLEAQHHGVPLDPSMRDDALRSYDAAIAYTDELLGEILDRIEASGRETCLLVLADHGEMFGEHGVWGHGHGLYRPVLQVPMVLHCPARIRGGRALDATVSLADVAPTLADLAGAGPLDADGVSLLPWLEGPVAGAPHEHGVFAEHEIPEYVIKALDLAGRDDEAAALRVRRRTVIHGPWRYEQEWPEGGSTREHLYRLDQDPDELRDLAGEGAVAGDLAAARARMTWWEDASVGPWRDRARSSPIVLPSDTELRLRALGYLD